MRLPADLKFSATLLVTVTSLLLPRAFALTPPFPGELEKLRQDGAFEERLKFAHALRNDRIRPDLLESFRLRATSADGTSKSFPGTPKVFALLVEFPSYPPTNDVSIFETKLFGSGKADEKPYESLREYYKRSSYGLLDIQGNVLPWYQAQNSRYHYAGGDGIRELIKEALDHHTATHDFSQYDNNGDGEIDYFMVIWTGYHGDWASQWWAWCDTGGGTFDSDPYTVDGKRLGVFSWQWEVPYVYGGSPAGLEFSPHTVIHETGHGLGLPDLYDYDDQSDDPGHVSTGPCGGVGKLDMMDANHGDHNAFSKWLLGWLTPTAIGDSEQFQSSILRPSSSYPDCVAIMPGQTGSDPFREFFLVQNRSASAKDENDYPYPADGLVIWHVDATLNGTGDGFSSNNTDTPVKLVRLMEADGLEQVEAYCGSYWADAGDFYTGNQFFSRISSPNSRRYSGQHTGVSVLNIVPDDSTLLAYKAAFVLSDSQLLSIGEGVDNTALDWDFGGDAVWFGRQMLAHEGGDAAQSGEVVDGHSCYTQVTVNGPGSVNFYWKVSSEANSDFLQFLIDGVLQDQISGTVDWYQKRFSVGAGSHTLRWRYSKDAGGSGGQDCAWLDLVEYGSLSLGEALDNLAASWITQSGSPWYAQTPESYYGGSSARSGNVGSGENSLFYTTVTDPVDVTFYWKVSSASGVGSLEFYVNAVLQDSITGNVDWEEKTFHVGSGTKTLAWQYKKTGAASAGLDCGWVDKVKIGDNQLGNGVDNYVLPWSTRGDSGWFYETSTDYYGGDAVQSGNVTNQQVSILETTAVGPGDLSFYWKESEDNKYGGDFYFRVDGQVEEIVWNEDWTPIGHHVGPGAHLLEWEYQVWGATPDQAWLDKVVYARDLTLEEALDNHSLPWTTYDPSPSNGWKGQDSVYTYGFDSARSGPVEDNHSSFLETTVVGPGTLTFSWSISSELNHDYLEFYVDASMKDRISGIFFRPAWRHQTYLIGGGSHTLQWVYYKDAAGSAGSDCGWVDHVAFAGTPSLREAVDNTLLVWNTTGDGGGWIGQTQTYCYEGDAAQSADISDNQQSAISTTLAGPGTLTFFWKTSCQYGWDKLTFSLDGEEMKWISGETDWQQLRYLIQPGSHTVDWNYVKNSAFSDGADCAWLDHVVFVSEPVPTYTPTATPIPTVSLAEALDNNTFDWDTAGYGHWFGRELATARDGDAAQSPPIGDGKYTRVFPNDPIQGPGALSFYWKVSSQWNGDFLRFHLDGNIQPVFEISGYRDWERKVYYIADSGTHEVMWVYWNDASGAEFDDCGWLDDVQFYPGPEWTNTPTTAPWFTLTHTPTPSNSPSATVPSLSQTPTPSRSPVTGDVDGDGNVDGNDLFYFSLFWRVEAGSADPNCNPVSETVADRVNASDLLLLLSLWQ